MRLHLSAVADNARSTPQVLELAWDGNWNDGTDVTDALGASNLNTGHIPYNFVKEIQIKTANQIRLIVMLYDGAIRQVNRALDLLAEGHRRYAETFSPYDVVGHLIHGERADWITRARWIREKGVREPFPPFDRFARKNSVSSAPHSAPRTPRVTGMRSYAMGRDVVRVPFGAMNSTV